MAKKIDLTGQRFGRWLVLEEAEKKDSRRRYLCRCKCGDEAVVIGENLERGLSKSCGCLGREAARSRKLIVMTRGMVFGRWTLVRDVTEGKGKSVWLCSCTCGTERVVDGHCLRKGYSKSCGCMQKELLTMYPTKEDKRAGARRRAKLPVRVGSVLFNRIPNIDGAEGVSGFINVKCKNCGKLYAPSRAEISSRVNAFSGVITGEFNFYCSDSCRAACPVFSFNPVCRIDPRSKLYVENSKTNKIRRCQNKSLKQLQCDEVGYTYCEKCGGLMPELHHTLEVARHGDEAINPAGHMLLCAGCHLELHRSCG